MRRKEEKEEHFALAKPVPLQQGRTEVRVGGELSGGRERGGGGLRDRRGQAYPLSTPSYHLP